VLTSARVGALASPAMVSLVASKLLEMAAAREWARETSKHDTRRGDDGLAGRAVVLDQNWAQHSVLQCYIGRTSWWVRRLAGPSVWAAGSG
jgi:hypothetical protein